MQGYSDRVFKLPYIEAVDIYIKHLEKQAEERRWQLYLSLYPFMAMEKLKAMEYSEFIKLLDKETEVVDEVSEVTGADKSEEEILAYIKELENSKAKKIVKQGEFF